MSFAVCCCCYYFFFLHFFFIVYFILKLFCVVLLSFMLVLWNKQHKKTERKMKLRNCSAAPRLIVFDWTTLINFHFAGGFGSTGWRSDTILDLGCHGHERLFNIGGILGRCLEEWNAQLLCVFLWLKQQQKTVYTLVSILRKNHEWYSWGGCFSERTIAVVWSTTFFVVKSHLLPTSNLLTFSHA